VPHPGKHDAAARAAGWASEDALAEAREVQLQAAAKAFDWRDISDVVSKVREEIAEVDDALARNNPEEARREVGDLLFSAVNLARFIEADPTAELRGATKRFSLRLAKLEEELGRRGHVIADFRVEELDQLWKRTKEPL
jgi:uncharacterized protein YabN with tetrapyrrole methylase and pyrophosphatase domain